MSIDWDELHDYVLSHGMPGALAEGEQVLAREMWQADPDYAAIAAAIVARRHAYVPADSEPGTDPAAVWCQYCNCTPVEHAQQFGKLFHPIACLKNPQ